MPRWYIKHQCVLWFNNVRQIFYVNHYAVCMYLFILTNNSRTNKPICTKLGTLIPWDQEEIETPKNCPEFKSWWGPVPVARKLSVVKKTVPRLKFFVWRKYYRSEGYNPKRASWVRVPARVDPVDWKRSTIKERLQDQGRLLWSKD
jgi:hypothetical protein